MTATPRRYRGPGPALNVFSRPAACGLVHGLDYRMDSRSSDTPHKASLLSKYRKCHYDVPPSHLRCNNSRRLSLLYMCVSGSFKTSPSLQRNGTRPSPYLTRTLDSKDSPHRPICPRETAAVNHHQQTRFHLNTISADGASLSSQHCADLSKLWATLLSKHHGLSEQLWQRRPAVLYLPAPFAPRVRMFR
jgi:hypothetical protein